MKGGCHVEGATIEAVWPNASLLTMIGASTRQCNQQPSAICVSYMLLRLP